jgi:hypothetical protein
MTFKYEQQGHAVRLQLVKQMATTQNGKKTQCEMRVWHTEKGELERQAQQEGNGRVGRFVVTEDKPFSV